MGANPSPKIMSRLLESFEGLGMPIPRHFNNPAHVKQRMFVATGFPRVLHLLHEPVDSCQIRGKDLKTTLAAAGTTGPIGVYTNVAKFACSILNAPM